MQNDGNFVVSEVIGGAVLWASGVAPTGVQGPYHAIMQADGNFVVYKDAGVGAAIWASGVIPGVGQEPYNAVMQDDGNFVIYQGMGGHAIWAVNGPRGSSLATNQSLNMGAYLTSP